MKPAEHDEVGIGARRRRRSARASHPRASSKSGSTARTKVGIPARSARARPSMPSRSAPTATTRGAVRRVGSGVEQGLQVGAGPGHEHDQACRRMGWARAQCIDRRPGLRRPAQARLRPPLRATRRRCHQVITTPPTRPPIAEGGDGVHEHVGHERARPRASGRGRPSRRPRRRAP